MRVIRPRIGLKFHACDEGGSAKQRQRERGGSCEPAAAILFQSICMCMESAVYISILCRNLVRDHNLDVFFFSLLLMLLLLVRAIVEMEIYLCARVWQDI